MKLFYKIQILILFCLFSTVTAGAVDIGKLTYTLNDKNLTATVTGYVGGYKAASGDLVIPESVKYKNKTYSVTSIGGYAFQSCSGFTGSLTIPESVTSIGEHAFLGCSGFTGNLTIGESVTEIGFSAFNGCSGFTGSLTIGNSVTSIGIWAFGSCSGFTGSLTIPNSVTSIGLRAFSNCSGFTGSLVIPESVTSIGDCAFCGCSGFTGDLTIGNSVTSIESMAFFNCSGFTGSLRIGNSVTSIGSFAFCGCSGFTTITSLNPIPPTLNSDLDFWYLYKKATLKVPDDNIDDYKAAPYWSDFSSIKGITDIDKTVTIEGIDIEIAPDGGENGEDVAKVTGGKTDTDGTLRIPDEIEIDGKKYPVTEISEGAFKNRTDIKKLIIPASVAKIGNEAFSGCTNLIEVVAEDGSKTMNCGNDAFKGAPIATLYLGRNTSGKPFALNNKLTNLKICDKVTSIGEGDFGGCSSIKNITVLATVPPTLPNSGFDGTVYKNTTLRVPDDNIDDYKSADGWKNFFNINTSGIEGIESEIENVVRGDGGNIIAPEGSEVYDLSGRRVAASGLRPGIYIVRIPGGKSVKIKL